MEQPENTAAYGVCLRLCHDFAKECKAGKRIDMALKEIREQWDSVCLQVNYNERNLLPSVLVKYFPHLKLAVLEGFGCESNGIIDVSGPVSTEAPSGAGVVGHYPTSPKPKLASALRFDGAEKRV